MRISATRLSVLQIKRITNSSARDIYPAWTYDDKIVFASNRTGDLELYKIDSDGSNLEQLPGPNYASAPSCAPDGRIAFSKIIRENYSDIDICVLYPDGSIEEIKTDSSLDGSPSSVETEPK